MRLLLAYRPPYDWAAMLVFLSARAIAGMETVVDGVYSRSIGLDGVHGTFSIKPVGDAALELTLDFPDPAGVSEIVARLRRMFDLDADLPAIHQQLATDPLMARLIAERPGLRVPGAWDGLELAIRAVLGQQITVRAAIKLAGKLVAQYGEALDSAPPGLTHVFPGAAVLAVSDLATLGMPKAVGERCPVWLRRYSMIRCYLSRRARAAWRGCWHCMGLATGRRSTLRCGSYGRGMRFRVGMWG